MAQRLFIKNWSIVHKEYINVVYDDILLYEWDDEVFLIDWKIVKFEEYKLTDEYLEKIKEYNITPTPEKYIVNITTKNKKKYAVVHKASEGIDYDEERWDITTDDLFIAEKYKSFIENESLEAAMDWYKSL